MIPIILITYSKIDIIANIDYIVNLIGITNIKWFLSLCIIVILFDVVQYLLSIKLILLFAKGDINIPLHLPTRTLNWLKELENSSQSENKDIMLKFYIKLLLFNLLIAGITLLFIILL